MWLRDGLFREMVKTLLLTAIVGLPGLFASRANALESMKTCAGVEITSINVATDTGGHWPASTKAEIDVVPQSSAAPEGNTRALEVIAYGPILGSAMNSPEVKTDLACSPDGVTLGVIIQHYGDGDTFKNALWRSKITLGLTLREDAVFQTIWKMRRPDGTELDRFQTAPYPEQKYPITVTKMLRSVSGQYLDRSEAFGQNSPLKAEIKSAWTTVHNHEDFSLATELRNTGDSEILIQSMSCAYSTWVADNPSVHVGAAVACGNHTLVKMSLKPGQVLHGIASVHVVLAPGKEQNQSVTFRLALKDETPPNWSNAVTVNVAR